MTKTNPHTGEKLTSKITIKLSSDMAREASRVPAIYAEESGKDGLVTLTGWFPDKESAESWKEDYDQTPAKPENDEKKGEE